ncbi:class I SAM-dependent methyltransferase [Nioella sp.]|uniref:class I SAM-dependent methyltransferase n=1 Tax=Nioella sp. TaxID=1912091 RepID=UPI003B52CC45
MDYNDILPAYDRVAGHWAETRNTSLFELGALTSALDGQKDATVLDLGCGSGLPIARWFTDQRCAVTGVDGSKRMLDHFRGNLPGARAVLADMRGLSLGHRFDVIVAWDSFFHLSREDQRAMLPVFATHAAPGARLLLTTGPEDSEAMGQVGPEPVIHVSLSPDVYRALLAAHGFEVLWFRPEDAEFHGHSVWLAQRSGGIA